MQDFFGNLFDGELSLIEGQVLIMLIGIPLVVLIRRVLKSHSAQNSQVQEVAEPEPEIEVKRLPRDGPKTLDDRPARRTRRR